MLITLLATYLFFLLSTNFLVNSINFMVLYWILLRPGMGMHKIRYNFYNSFYCLLNVSTSQRFYLLTFLPFNVSTSQCFYFSMSLLLNASTFLSLTRSSSLFDSLLFVLLLLTPHSSLFTPSLLCLRPLFFRALSVLSVSSVCHHPPLCF